MENVVEKIYDYYSGELNLIRHAYGRKSFLVKSIIIIVSIAFLLFYFINPLQYKVLIMVGVVLIFLMFYFYSVHRVVKKYRNDVKGLNFWNYATYYDAIKEELLLKFINGKGLLHLEGIKYLIEVFTKKSEKFKIPSITIWVFVIASLIQSTIDLIFNGEAKDFTRINSYFKFLRDHAFEGAIILFFVSIFYIIIKHGIKEVSTFIINRKSNSYNDLSGLLENKVLPIFISNELVRENPQHIFVMISNDKVLDKKNNPKSIRVKKRRKNKQLNM